MRPNILHGNKFSGLGGIGARGGIFSVAVGAFRQLGTIREGLEAAEGPIRLQSWSRLQSGRESLQTCGCADPRLVPSGPKTELGAASLIR
jgi:hypothetical protein